MSVHGEKSLGRRERERGSRKLHGCIEHRRNSSLSAVVASVGTVFEQGSLLIGCCKPLLFLIVFFRAHHLDAELHHKSKRFVTLKKKVFAMQHKSTFPLLPVTTDV